MIAFLGKLAMPFTLLEGEPPQTIWSTRVPCPGGSGAGTVAREACVCASPESDVWGALTTGGFTAGGGATGAGVEMLEILIENDPHASSGTL
jgi:hypothetical protein